jgi:prepilin-type N-terminal cleavage/methylation domain-containing protein
MYRKTNDAGLTLAELLVVIALTAVVASLTMPVLINTLSTAQAAADARSQVNLTAFSNDWTTSGYTVNATANGFEAVDAHGTVVASIQGSASANGGGGGSAVVTGTLDLSTQGWGKLPSSMTGASGQQWNSTTSVLVWRQNFFGYSFMSVADAQALLSPYSSLSAVEQPVVNSDGSVSAGFGRNAVRVYHLLSNPETGVANITTL